MAISLEQRQPTIEDFFGEACKLVALDKTEMYGSGYANMRRIARLWSDYLGMELQAKDVAAMMILHKVSRIVESKKAGDINPHDSWIDIAGYAALGDSV